MNPAAERTALFDRAWVQALVLAVVVLLVFGANLEGGLVWDDAWVVAPAARLASAWDAFGTDLFATGAGQGARYYRPLVSLSYWLDYRLFGQAPHLGLHLTNLLWHAAASILALRALRRWAPVSVPPVACLLVAALWAALPAKAENVAWISGRADPMGVALLLAGLEAFARFRQQTTRAFIAVVATAAALGCKESFVVAPLLFAVELRAAAQAAAARSTDRAPDRGLPHPKPDRGSRERTDPPRTAGQGTIAPGTRPATGRWPDWIATASSAGLWASVAVVGLYFCLRAWLLPIETGGEGTIAAVGLGGRLGLFVETIGLAAVALLSPWHASLLRGPIAFDGPTRLVHDAPLIAIGVLALALGLWALWRRPAWRDAVTITLGCFLPTSNLVTTALEARLSDRFLYLPSLGLALGLLMALTMLPAKLGRGALVAAALGTAALAVLARVRSEKFASADTLFSWERTHGERAATVLENAGTAAARAKRFREARDIRLEQVARLHALGFRGEGWSEQLDAVRYQVEATGESHPASLERFERLLGALLSGRAELIVVELDDGRQVSLDTGSVDARALAQQRSLALRMFLAELWARTGEPKAMELAADTLTECPRCTAVVLAAASAALALAQPNRAAEWLARLGPNEPAAEPLALLVEREREALASPTATSKPVALFLGAAYGPCCRLAQGEPSLAQLRIPAMRELLASACVLAGKQEGAAAFAGASALTASARDDAERLRHDPARRAALARQALGAAEP